MVSKLGLKLLRDIWLMRGQVLAISLVIASGVATFVMSVSTLDALKTTRTHVYQNYRFADIFASLKRAPASLSSRISAIDGVKKLEIRIVSQIRLEVANFDEPVNARILSIPDNHSPVLNDLHLVRGKLPNAEKDQILLSELFANAHQLNPGDQITAIINGHKQQLRISGIANSAEYIYALAPGALFPDNKRFGIIWMKHRELASSFDMQGAFNDLVLMLDGQEKALAVIEQLDNLLADYGGAGAYLRKDQNSHHFLEQEFRGLETLATLFPVIFLGVAGFLLNVVLTRLMNTEREQIGLLKAFGYTNLRIAWHYLQFVFLVCSLGVTAGILLGAWFGQGMANLYMGFFNFPYLLYQVSVETLGLAFLFSYLVAVSATLVSVYRAVKLPVAEAMRPEPPMLYKKSLLESTFLMTVLSQPSRMIVRHLSRKPVKSLLTLLGIAMASAIMMLGNFQEDSINYMLDFQYEKAQREDMVISFTEPVSRRARYEIQRIPGVQQVEAFRYAPIRIHHQHRRERTVIQAINPDARLHRLLDRDFKPINLPTEGIVLNDFLAKLLDVKVGDKVTVEILTGHKPVFDIEISSIVEEMLGISAYMRLQQLNRYLKEGTAIDGLYLAVEQDFQHQVYKALQKRPSVAAITLTDEALQSALATLGESILIFTFVNTLLASGIAFGVIYNSMRIAFAERNRELASLRVLGFSHSEVAYILLGEMLVLTIIAIPLGFLIGRYLCRIIVDNIASELYRIPLILNTDAYSFSASVVLFSALISSLIIWNKLKQQDLILVLKTRE